MSLQKFLSPTKQIQTEQGSFIVQVDTDVVQNCYRLQLHTDLLCSPFLISLFLFKDPKRSMYDVRGTIGQVSHPVAYSSRKVELRPQTLQYPISYR